MVLLTIILNVINQFYFFYTNTIPKDSLRLAEENIRLLFFKEQRRVQPSMPMQNIVNRQQRQFNRKHD